MPGHEYTNIKYTTETASGQVTPTSPAPNYSIDNGSSLPSIGLTQIPEAFQLEPPPLPKRPQRKNTD